MGQTLSEPVTIKVSDSGEDERLYFGVSSMQGWRISMEDAHAAVLDMAPDLDRRIAWFAVFDGHGGITLSLFFCLFQHMFLSYLVLHVCVVLLLG